MQTSLLAIANKAKDRKHYRFLNLYRLIGDENFLLECWSDIRIDAAYGVDRVSAQQYGENLINNIRDLIERLRRKSYRARLVRRHYIPKPDVDPTFGVDRLNAARASRCRRALVPWVAFMKDSVFS